MSIVSRVPEARFGDAAEASLPAPRDTTPRNPWASAVKVPDAVKKMYTIVKKTSGSVGGYGHAGPVYGEITAGSLQKIVNFMKERCGFDESSAFVDIGAGLGKPNFHVAVDPGVKLSYGIEVEELRWVLSLQNLQGLLNKNAVTNTFMHCTDVTALGSLEPFSHVYMFDVGFPPDVLVSIANTFNQSTTARTLVSFKGPREVIGKYGFAVKEIGGITTRMCGSSETHKAYIYESTVNDLEGTAAAGKRHKQLKIGETFRAARSTRSATSQTAKKRKRENRGQVDADEIAPVATASHPDWPGSAIDLNVHANLAYLTEEGRSDHTVLLHEHLSKWLDSSRGTQIGDGRGRTRRKPKENR